MGQPELGNEEEQDITTSSAELSESETATTPEASIEETTGVEETPTEIDDAQEESVAETDEVAGGDDVAPADADDADSAEDDAPQDDPNGLRRGMVLEGKVASTTPNEIFVDLGDGREGIVPKGEVELMTVKMLEQMQEGETVHVYIVNPKNHEGNTILSINRAQEELDWREAEEYMQSKDVYDGKIGGYNKGGLIVRFGRLRGFVPQSQISDKRMLDIDGETPEEKYSGLVNRQISVKVMEVDRSRNRLILSERAAMREVRQRRKEALITELNTGEIRDGRVVSLENFGAFVDVGGAEGLVHITELSYQHVTHPRQILDVGQEVTVKVISVDEDKNRIGLSIKQLQPDPWDTLAGSYNVGSLVRGEVTKLTKFGAFAKLIDLEAVEGLVHISELSDDRVEHPKDVVNRGDKLTLRIVKIDVKQRRLGLSLRRVNSPEFLDMDLRRAYSEAEDRASDAAMEAEDMDVEIEDNADVSDVADAGTAAEPEVIAEEVNYNDGGDDTEADTASEPETDAEEVHPEPETDAEEVHPEPEAEVDDATGDATEENAEETEAEKE